MYKIKFTIKTQKKTFTTKDGLSTPRRGLGRVKMLKTETNCRPFRQAGHFYIYIYLNII